MFKKDPGFLADEPAKSALPFRLLLARQELQLPGFITAEPCSSKYGVSPLSEEEVQQLTGVPAFDDFRESHPNLFIDPSGAQTAPPASGDEAALASSEEHTSELQPLMRISSAVFCLKKKIPH